MKKTTRKASRAPAPVGTPDLPEGVLVVFKKSALALAKENRNRRIAELLRKGDVSVARMRESDQAHQHTLAVVEKTLSASGVPFRMVYRAQLRKKMTRDRLVVTVGGDGTLLDASHKTQDSPVLGVNSDPESSVGFLCAANANTFEQWFTRAMNKRLLPVPLVRMHATIDDEPLPFFVLNDVLVAHKNPAATSRLLINFGQQTEDQRSSGAWVATATGSTAAMVSSGGEIRPLDDVNLQVRVREPFLADGPALNLLHFDVEPGQAVRFVSKMREGRVYFDGPHETRELTTGQCLTLTSAAPPLWLYATPDMARRRQQAQAHAKARRQRAR